MTVTETRTSGRTSAAITPSLRATSITSYSPARPAITCTTRGSLARASFSMRSSSATFSDAVIESSGSLGAYSARPPWLCRLLATLTRPVPALPMVRVAAAACISAGRLMSSE